MKDDKKGKLLPAPAGGKVAQARGQAVIAGAELVTGLARIHADIRRVHEEHETERRRIDAWERVALEQVHERAETMRADQRQRHQERMLAIETMGRALENLENGGDADALVAGIVQVATARPAAPGARVPPLPGEED